ncbi:MAG TPA: hypothetical protein VFI03_02180 [Solirubrobacterales bacterium]|nr:hypothetical protein [Solirubrobacterales bacterium]
MPVSQRGLARLLAGFAKAGYRVVERHGDFPCLLVLADRREKGEGERLSVWVQALVSGGQGPREPSMRISVPRAAFRVKAQAPTLILGYSPKFNVFAGWPAYRFHRSRPGRQLWVPRSALAEAAEAGLAKGRGNSSAVAFRPEKIHDYLRLHHEVQQRVMVSKKRRFVASSQRMAEFRRRAKRVSEAGAGGEYVVREHRKEELGLDREEKEVRKEIETGLARPDSPGSWLPSEQPLAAATEYLYWFGIGAETGGSIETTPVAPPEGLPHGARLTVLLFPFEEEMKLTGPTRGELELLSDGTARVSRAALEIPNGDGLEKKLLFFAVRTPQRKGVQRLRCNLYYGATLLQSRLLSCRVGGKADPDGRAIRSDLDYSLTSALDRSALTKVPGHDLSLLVNGGGLAGAETHEFRFFGAEQRPVEASASLGVLKVENLIETSRGALRKASWDTEKEWVEKVDTYRYEDPKDGYFEEDLIRQARAGGKLFNDICSELAADRLSQLEEAMRRPGRVQIASVEEGLYVPAAIFYDHPLELVPGRASQGQFKVCEEFLDALKSAQPLESSRCIGGDCPSYFDERTVCPSGFWGYRHQIGWPLGSEDEELAASVDFSGRAEMVIGISTDPSLTMRDDHVKEVLKMGRGEVAETREVFRDLAKANYPHLVYLYCHGGSTKVGEVPFLELGPPGSDGLSSSYLKNQKIRWGKPPPRPLVFINGCHTTALEPRILMNLVGGFVNQAQAVGVVGTEVTVFESLACTFAETVLANFLDGSMTIGAAIRRARFELLRARNPLGLVYVPFVAPEIRLVGP